MRYVLTGNGVSALACPVLVHGVGGVAGLGLVGSAWANVLGQTAGAVLFLAALHRERASAPPEAPVRLRPVPSLLRAQLGAGP